MESTRKRNLGIVALVFIGLAIFGYTQYLSVSQVSASAVQSELLGTDESGSNYYIELEFTNPTLLALATGETEFAIESDGEKVGEGVLDPLTLPPLSKATVTGTYHAENADSLQGPESESPVVRIVGETEYDMLFVSIEVPFEYYPTDEQARGFIHQG